MFLHNLLSIRLIVKVGYLDQLKHRNQLLRVLVEDEIYRVGVWANPMNDAKRGTDHVVTTDRSMTEVRSVSASAETHMTETSS